MVRPFEVYYKWTREKCVSAVGKLGWRIVRFRIPEYWEQYLNPYSSPNNPHIDANHPNTPRLILEKLT